MDFEKALTLKHTHRNARNYLVQTQVAYGERYLHTCTSRFCIVLELAI